MNIDQTDVGKQELFGHPKGLLYLFFAELWERFSFYGMKALLVLYMTKHLLYSDNASFGVMAAYMSLVYVTPMIGGMIADRYIGYRKSIILGGVLMAAGHFFLTIETAVFFYGSLALIIVGNGFFKPNISTMVGALYKKGDGRRDSGFTIFYLGINIGGAVAPLACAWFAEVYGWHYGFLLAGIGMMVGLLVFKRGTQLDVFGTKGLVPDIENYKKRLYGLNTGDRIWFLAWLSVPLFALIVRFNEFEHYLVWVASLFLIGYITYILIQVSVKERKRLLVVVYFTTLYALFSAVFEQAGSSLTLFADRNVNLVGINAAQTNSINSTWIVLLAIPFAILWTFLSKKKANPNSAIKFGLGMLFLGLGFVVFGMSAQEVDEYARTPMFYLIFGYLILTVGELFLSPIGLSKITELSPLKYATFIMGVWFSANFYGHFFAGKIAKLTTVKEGEGSVFSEGVWGTISQTITGISSTVTTENTTEAFQQLYSYVSVYANFGVITMGIGVVALLISPIIKELMEGVH
ncbi:peptide MFS transporter [Aquimarina longa]|uniref:peptide MFS transporter n=1 Tax=Aquimarina longa TaxID=1080221 RepID=UPI0007861EAA|nr:peptide MFS transporter [Aquimarina longa]